MHSLIAYIFLAEVRSLLKLFPFLTDTLYPAEESMITVKRLSYAVCCAFLCIGLGVTIGQSQETASDYLAPSQAVPTGTAPRMQVQLLSRGEQTKEYAVIFGEGDEAFSGLLAFAQKYHVTSAHFTAIGGLSRATLAWFDPKREMFKKISINGQVEVLAMIGDIALYQGKPVVHTHMVVGRLGWNHARRSCSRGLCISDAGGDGNGRSDRDAEAARPGKWTDPD